MPKAPVLSREYFYTRLRDGSFRLLDFALINTSLGAMIESRPVEVGRDKTTDTDVYDRSFTKISEIDDDEFFKLTGFSGRQALANNNTQ